MPRRKSKVEFTLFPFLSVLSGLIAVNVLLLIVVIGTRMIDSGQRPEAGEGGLGANDSAVVGDGIDAASYQELEKQIETLEKNLKQRELAYSNLRLQLREIAGLILAKEVELEQSKAAAAPRQGVRIGEPTPVKIIPTKDGSGVEKIPVFIEVSSTGFIVHPQKLNFSYDPGPNPKMPAEIPDGLKKVIADLAKDSGKRYPLLLIHTDGTEAFRSILRHIGMYDGLGVGWEPFSREWLVDTGSK